MSKIQLPFLVSQSKQDSNGRYRLNDLHKAAGGEKTHQPSNWTILQQTKDIVDELSVTNRESDDVLQVINGGNKQGTYGNINMLLSYARWMSPKLGLIIETQMLSQISDLDKILNALQNFDLDDEEIKETMYVYAIKESDTSNVKIGISKDPYRRLKQLQTANSSKLELVTYVEAKDRYKTEKYYHQLNSDSHIHGE